MIDKSKLPRWTSHKEVSADEIVEFYTERKTNKAHLKLRSGQVLILNMGDPIFSRYIPKPGDFLVVYDNNDDYMSLSPRNVFLEGYTPKGEIIPLAIDSLPPFPWEPSTTDKTVKNTIPPLPTTDRREEYKQLIDYIAS